MIKKVVNGEAKAVSCICKRSYNLFDEDKLADAQNGAMSYDKRKKTLTITDSYYTDPNLKLKYCAPSLKVGKTYVLTFKTTATRKAIFVRIPGTDGALWNSGQSRTITAYDLNSNIYFYGVKGEICTIKELQIVEGAETKPYVPYLLDITKVKKVIDVTDQMTDSVGNPYWNAENQEWTGAHMKRKEYCHVGNAKPIFEKHGLQRYVVEFDGRSDIEGRIDLYSLSGGNYGYRIGQHVFRFTTDWQHHEIGFIPTIMNNSTEGNCIISFYGNYGTGVIPHIKNLKIRTAEDVFTHVTSEVAEGTVEISPAEVADGVLTIKGDNVKVENNKLIIL